MHQTLPELLKASIAKFSAMILQPVTQKNATVAMSPTEKMSRKVHSLRSYVNLYTVILYTVKNPSTVVLSGFTELRGTSIGRFTVNQKNGVKYGDTVFVGHSIQGAGIKEFTVYNYIIKNAYRGMTHYIFAHYQKYTTDFFAYDIELTTISAIK